MIFTKIEIDNLFCFKDSALDLTFKRIPKDTTIPLEYIKGREKFYFKKVCVISGANASGKTSLGRVMCTFQNFMVNDTLNFEKNITHQNKKANLTIEFVTENDYKIHKIQISIPPKDKGINIKYASCDIGKSDSATTARKKINKIFDEKGNNLKTSKFLKYNTKTNNEENLFNRVTLKNIFSSVKPTWRYDFSENYDSSKPIEKLKYKSLGNLLDKILKTFDPSIKEVVKSNNEGGKLNGYSVIFANEDSLHIDLDGVPSNKKRLSRGTYDAIKLSNFILSVFQKSCSTLYLDEQLAYTHSYLEQTIINLIIDKLQRHSQFFYTTHNYDILDLNIPIHSYIFLKKEGDYVEFIHPEKSFKKNDRKLLNYVKNDLFETDPNTDLLDDLL